MLSVSLLIVASCKKSNPTEEDKQPNCQLTEVSWSNDDAKTIYSYNPDGTVSNSKFTDDSYSEVFTYSKNQIIVIEKDWHNTAGLTHKYDLDPQGRVTKHTKGYNGTSSVTTTTYIYNLEGYLIEENEVEGITSKITKHTYSNGNLVSSNDGTYTTTFTYNNDLALENFYHDYMGRGLPKFYDSPLQKYFGKLSKNQLSKTTYSIDHYVEYTYEKDDMGNVVKVKRKDFNPNGGDSSYIATNKYSCK